MKCPFCRATFFTCACGERLEFVEVLSVFHVATCDACGSHEEACVAAQEFEQMGERAPRQQAFSG